MALWGAKDGEENKPKNLTTEEKRKVFASTRGWEQPMPGNDNANAQPEVLACVSDLSTKLGGANISAIELSNIDDAPFVSTDVLQVLVTFNEKVDVTGTPQIQLAFAGGTPSTGQATYQSGDGTNQLLFEYSVVAGNVAAAGEFTIDVAQNSIDLNGGAINDSEDGTAAELDMTNSGPDGSTDLRAVFNTDVADVTIN